MSIPLRSLRLVLLLVAPVFVSCAESDGELKARIHGQVSPDRDVVLRISDLTDFHWERFYVFHPYMTPDRISSCLGFAWSGAAGTGIEHSDSIALLVFTAGKKVVRHVEQPRGSADFTGIGRCEGWTPESAIFLVRAGGAVEFESAETPD